MRIKTDLTRKDIRNMLTKPISIDIIHDILLYGTEYNINGTIYYLPIDEDVVYLVPTVKELRKLKLNKIEKGD